LRGELIVIVVGTVGNVKRAFGDKCNATWWL